MNGHRLIADVAVETDVEAAFDWDDNEQVGLGHEFLVELRAAYVRIADGPLKYVELRRCCACGAACSPGSGRVAETTRLTRHLSSRARGSRATAPPERLHPPGGFRVDSAVMARPTAAVALAAERPSRYAALKTIQACPESRWVSISNLAT